MSTARVAPFESAAPFVILDDADEIEEREHLPRDHIVVETFPESKLVFCLPKPSAMAAGFFQFVGLVMLALVLAGEYAFSQTVTNNPFARGASATNVPFARRPAAGNILIVRGPSATNVLSAGSPNSTNVAFARGQTATNATFARTRANTNNPFARGGVVRGQAAESEYWYQFHIKLNRQKKLSEQELQRQRAEAKVVIPWLIKEGEAMEPEIIAAQNEPTLPPPPPSFFEGKRDYILFGFAFVLIAVVSGVVLVRHKREAEIRALTGVYLSDGREIAHFKMPSLFDAPVSLPAPIVDLSKEDASTGEEEVEAADKEGPLAEFFAAAPERLAEIRKILPELGRAFDEEERRTTLSKLRELICVLKEKANCWDLRPVWQLTSAVELLLTRLIEKGKEATPSTLRTVASTMDLLAELCVPGIRPDLIINPPISVLAVDDDPLCLRAVVYALQKADMIPDVAKDGAASVALAAEKSYDVVFMDIMMPVMDGLTACTKIHETAKNKTTPVVFVTARTDFRARTESTLVGGADLMAKPFLMFEITVKALAFAMRKRLDLAESCRRDLAALDALSRVEGTAPRANVSKSTVAPQPVAA